MNYSERYNFKLPETSDPADIDDLNNNFEKIDKNMQAVFVAVVKSGTGSSEVVDLIPLTEGNIYIDGTKIKIDYPTSALSNNRQIINGYTLMDALRRFIPNFNSSRVQTLGHDSAGNISWRNV